MVRNQDGEEFKIETEFFNRNENELRYITEFLQMSEIDKTILKLEGLIRISN